MLVRSLDQLTRTLGVITSWLCILMALLTCFIVVMRYAFGTGSIALQETSTYMHAAIFLLGACVALQNSAHVRVDIIYRGLSSNAKHWIDLIGHIVFLLPLCAFMVYISWGFVASSWAIQETSADAGGLAFVYLLKTLIPVGASCLALQAVAELTRAVQGVLKGDNG